MEDELLLRISTVMHLQEQGYRVLNAKNAEVAQRILGETHIDLVFSDIRMPGRLDGMGLAAWIRLTHPDVLVLLTTEGDILHPREHAFIDKPYRIADLIPAVAALLRGSTNETARRR